MRATDSAAWLTAWATVGAAIGTIGAVMVSLWLALRDADRRSREARRRQAAGVTAWLGTPPTGREGDPAPLWLSNTSGSLLYRVIASVVDMCAPAADARPDEQWRWALLVLPPGITRLVVDSPDQSMERRCGIELVFRDAAGLRQRRTAEGVLSEIRVEPETYYPTGPESQQVPGDWSPTGSPG